MSRFYHSQHHNIHSQQIRYIQFSGSVLSNHKINVSEQIAEYKMKVEDNKMENTKKVSMLEVVKGMITGFAVGVIWELMIITPLMSDWTLRSIIVALTVSGCGCSIAGGIFAFSKKNKVEKSEDKNTVVA